MKDNKNKQKISSLLVGNFNSPPRMSEYISSRRQKLSTPLIGRLNDRDRDLTPDWIDCDPNDPTQHGFWSSAKSAVSKAVSKAKSVVSSGYKAVDKAVGGKLPGGVPSSSGSTPAPSSSTSTSSSKSSGGGGSSGASKVFQQAVSGQSPTIQSAVGMGQSVAPTPAQTTTTKTGSFVPGKGFVTSTGQVYPTSNPSWTPPGYTSTTSGQSSVVITSSGGVKVYNEKGVEQTFTGNAIVPGTGKTANQLQQELIRQGVESGMGTRNLTSYGYYGTPTTTTTTHSTGAGNNFQAYNNQVGSGTITSRDPQRGWDAIKQAGSNVLYNTKQFFTGKNQYIRDPFAPLKTGEVTSYTIPEQTIPIYRRETLMTDPKTGKTYSPSILIVPETTGNTVQDIKNIGAVTLMGITKGTSATIAGLDKIGSAVISKTPEPIREYLSVANIPAKTLLTSARTGFDIIGGYTYAQDKPAYKDMFELSTSRDVPIWKRIAARTVIGYESRDIQERSKRVEPVIKEFNRVASNLDSANKAYERGDLTDKEYEKVVKEYEEAKKKLEDNEDYSYIQSRGGISAPFSTMVAQSNLSEGGKFLYAFGNTATKFIPPMIPLSLAETATEGALALSEGKVGTAAASAGQFYLFSKLGGKGGGKAGALGVTGLIGVGQGVGTFQETGSLSSALGAGTGALAGIYGGRAVQNLGRITVERRDIPKPRRDLKSTETISFGDESGAIYGRQKLGQFGREGSRAVTSSVWRDITRRNAQRLGIKVSDDFLRIYKGNPYAQPDVYRSELARLKRTYGISDWKAREVLRLDAPRAVDYGIARGVVAIDGDKSRGVIQFVQEPQRIDTGVQGIKTRGGQVTTDTFLFQRRLVDTKKFGRGAISDTLRVTEKGGKLTGAGVFEGGKLLGTSTSREFILGRTGDQFNIRGRDVTPSKSLVFGYDRGTGRKTIQYSRGLEVRPTALDNRQTGTSQTSRPSRDSSQGEDRLLTRTITESLTGVPSTPTPTLTRQAPRTLTEQPRTVNLGLSVAPIMDLKIDTKQRDGLTSIFSSRGLEKQDKKERSLVMVGMGTDILTRTQQDTSLKDSSVFSTALGTTTAQDTSLASAQTFNLISPTTEITQTISPVSTIAPISTIPRPTIPKPVDPIIGGFWFPEERKKLKSDVPYDAFVYRDATKKQKAKWQQVANNVPLITALSRGAREVDNSASTEFRVVRDKGKVNQIIDTAWNSLRNKFRDYTQKSGIKVGLRPGRYLEKRQFRIDSPGEVRAIPGQASIGRRFGRL